MAGIEPASFSFLVGLLRAQIEKNCRPRMTPISLPQAYPKKLSSGRPWAKRPKQVSLFVAQIHSMRPRVAERCLLIKRQGRVVTRRLFYVSGSFTWLRRPRLASPTSTTKVEACHPRMVIQSINSTALEATLYRLRAPASSLAISLLASRWAIAERLS